MRAGGKTKWMEDGGGTTEGPCRASISIFWVGHISSLGIWAVLILFLDLVCACYVPHSSKVAPLLLITVHPLRSSTSSSAALGRAL